MTNRFAFIAGETGTWRIRSIAALAGSGLPAASALTCVPVDGASAPSPARGWRLDGLVSNVRYATRDEVVDLSARQEGLGRPQARLAALIPIAKSARWWGLAQDERRAIFEETSHHTAVGLEYLPAIARKLFHARDIGEPFDFLTWFEFAPEHEAAFDDLLARLRATAEWAYVEREVDIRLERI
jgi:hypothetical protein